MGVGWSLSPERGCQHHSCGWAQSCSQKSKNTWVLADHVGCVSLSPPHPLGFSTQPRIRRYTQKGWQRNNESSRWLVPGKHLPTPSLREAFSPQCQQAMIKKGRGVRSTASWGHLDLMSSRGILEYFGVTTEGREVALPAQPYRLNALYLLVSTECGLAGVTVTIGDLGGF